MVLFSLQACSDIQVYVQSKQSAVHNQVWHFARQVLKALEKGKGVQGFYKGVINHGS